MAVRILTVGKRHDQNLSTSIEEYTTRLSGFAKPEWVIIPQVHAQNKEQQIEYESTALLAKLKPNEYVILLDEKGALLTNQELASKFEGVMNNGSSTISFIIGGAYGVNQAVTTRASFIWSLSPLVFPHQIVRLILVEQLYRTFSLLQGHPYHHE